MDHLNFIIYIILHSNNIRTISLNCFTYASELKVLDLSNNAIIHLAPALGVRYVHFLNVSHNKLANLDFHDIQEHSMYILSLDISGNAMFNLTMQDVIWFTNLQVLWTDDTRFCCLNRSMDICHNMLFLLSNCYNLIDSPYVITIAWIMAVMNL